jgi:hypothetical protein
MTAVNLADSIARRSEPSARFKNAETSIHAPDVTGKRGKYRN